jgi:hypothetical protein
MKRLLFRLMKEYLMSIFNRLFAKKDQKPAAEAEAAAPAQMLQTDDAIPDITKAVENPRFKELFAQWNESKSDADLSNLMEEIVLRARFLAVFESSAEFKDTGNHTAVIEKDTVLSLPLISDAEGHAYQPVFGDWVEVGKWQGLKQPPKSLILSFDDLHEMLVKQENIAGIVINPFGESFVMSREWVAALKIRKDVNLKGMAEVTVNKPTKVMLGEPKVYPVEMVRAIREHLGNSSCVKRAWLRLMMKDGEQSFLLVLDFTGDRGTVFGGIAQAARPFLNGMYIDMVPFEDDFGQRAVDGVEPFFAR